MIENTPVIPPLIARHAGDAAFYWQQHDGSVHSPLVGLLQLLEFDRLLDAHLDGLRVAGELGWETALVQLQRWERAPEAFVCSLLALEHSDPGRRLAQIWSVVQQNPERMLRGLISALAWVPAELGLGWCRYWINDEERTPVSLKVAAWRALAIRYHQPGQSPLTDYEGMGETIEQALPKALASGEAHLRAAACRFLSCWNEQHLPPLLQDAEPSVRAEAAIGLIDALHRPHEKLLSAQIKALQSQAASVLWTVTYELSQQLGTLTGWYRNRAQHRLMRWLCHLGLVAPMGHPGIIKLIELLPPRLGLWFVLHHGDGHYLPWVVQQMANEEVSRLAGWVWSMFTGVDLHSRSLALPPRGPGEASRPTDVQDPGLLEPNIAAIEGLSLVLPSHVVSLHGQTISPGVLYQAMWQAPQAIRWIANQRLVLLGKAPLCIRTHARIQQAHLPLSQENPQDSDREQEQAA
jgi:hypothetical protein